MTDGIFAALGHYFSRSDEAHQAVARPARVRLFADITGIGEIRLTGKKAVYFGAVMLEEPSFTFGVVMRAPARPGTVPFANAVVLKWRRQGKFWVGADMAFMVDSPDPQTRVKFSMTFEAPTLRSSNPLRGHETR